LGLLVDETADALNTASASQAADDRLGDALDVIAQHLAVHLNVALPAYKSERRRRWRRSEG